MSTELDREIDDLVAVLRGQARTPWADEVAIPLIAGRCAGSYGCSVSVPNRSPPPAHHLYAGADPADTLAREMNRLLAAGVSGESAIGVLKRKYRDDVEFSDALEDLIHDPPAVHSSRGSGVDDGRPGQSL